MDSIRTMDLNSADSGMVSIQSKPPENTDRPSLPPPIDTREPHKNGVEKNVYTSKEEPTMNLDSTPINDLMSAPEVMEQSAQLLPPQQIQQQQQSQPQQPTEPTKAGSKNPMNLTDDQYNAAIVGIVCVVAFSDPVQNKLANLIPQFVNDSGTRSTTGMAITGASAALIYYFGMRMLKR